MSAYDAWVTREPDYDTDECPECGETFSHGVWIAREHAVKFASACPTCFKEGS